MSSAFILQHSPAFGPGRIVPVIRDFGIPVQVRKVFAGDEAPSDLDEVRLVISLGGPQRVADVGGEKHPYLQKEIDLLKRMAAIDRPVLGIGLGAQLLAHAAGGKVHPNTMPGAKPEDPATEPPEFGWGPVTFPFPGGTEPIVMGLMDGAMMFHWHADTLELPRLPAPAAPPPPGSPPPPTGNALLSSSRLCKNEAFRFKNRLFGFQYHFELTIPEIEAIVAEGKDPAQKALGPDAAKKINDDTARYYSRYARLGDRILRNFVQFTKTY